ncbi:MAG: ATP-dependent metallopeptidase FtsH/Yme1/Tma family protein, partial [Rhodospirillales bacterium]|nr:ATP-dependent metallopeptidase FtsH/Yme1/Tma family protein [Rhodospirillales bacterium]
MALWLVIALLVFALFNLFQGTAQRGQELPLAFSDFLTSVEAGDIRDVTLQGSGITGHYRDGRNFSTYAPDNANLVPILTKYGVRISALPYDDDSPTLFSILISWFPMLLLIGVWIFFMRQMQSGGGKAMGFGKSRARLLTENSNRVTFEDVAGIDEAKQELEEIVEFLKDPHKFQRLGGKIPKGCLLVGPPGTGKTLLARAIAGEANVPFFTISGSDFVEMFVGVGASRVRDMFE